MNTGQVCSVTRGSSTDRLQGQRLGHGIVRQAALFLFLTMLFFRFIFDGASEGLYETDVSTHAVGCFDSKKRSLKPRIQPENELGRC